VIFSSQDKLDSSTRSAMEILLPYLDAALRGVALLPHNPSLAADSLENGDHGLSERESEIMDWVKMGKTNGEIGSILSISAFTVKNHMQRIFKKLDVYNRMQAVSKIERSVSHG
jgi:transcriptional regulator EpsA